MLHQGKLISPAGEHKQRIDTGLIRLGCETREVVQYPVDELGFDLKAADTCRSLDRLLNLVARHPAGEVEAGIDLLRKVGEQRAGPEIFRAHGQCDIDMGPARAGTRDQQSDKDLRFVECGSPRIAEQLLELINKDQHIAAFGQISRRAPEFDRARSAAELAVEFGDFLRGGYGPDRPQQGSCEVRNRLSGGPEVGDQPVRASARHEPEIERMEQPGPHE
nr:hypothetical protein [Acidisoma sp. S159]